MARYLGACMKIEVKEFVEEMFTVEIPDDTPEDGLDAAVEEARAAYEGERYVSLNSINWEHTTENHDDIAELLVRYRPDTPIFPAWLNEHDRECWEMYIKDYFPACGLHLNYKLWLAGDEYHNPREVARVLKEGA